VLAPIIVAVGHDLHQSVSAIGQARTLLAGTAALASLRIGRSIDRLGVRPAILRGALLALAGLALTAAAPNLGVFYAGHALVGLGVAFLLSAGFAGAGAWFDAGDSAWALGFVVGSQSIPWVLGNPLVGLLTDAVSWRLAYAVPGAFVLAALVAGFLAPRERRAPATEGEPAGVGQVLADPSARRWAIAELVAYSVWTAELTYLGAFYIKQYGVGESVVGLLLAAGSSAFLIATLSTDRIVRRVGARRPVVVAGALAMGGFAAVIFNVTPSVGFTVVLFFVMALCGGLRATSSSALALSQLPAQPGSMMAARTAAAQFGYMVGAVLGGVVLAVADFGALGFVLLGGLALSALLVLRVNEPERLPVVAAAPARAQL
ncbi:MAG: transporter, family, inner rane transport protein, partial [Thermoleophilaceae bacterium]|nr:transporter, family, inner rane transport protein [Thermoleophilaceae bacterium]